MALEGINTAQYDAFVSFARANLAERGGKSVARLAEGGAARAISAADPMDKLRMDVLVAESKLEYGRFDSLVSEAAGVDMSDYEGLDFEGEFEHDPEYAEPICQDFLATIAKNPEAYDQQ